MIISPIAISPFNRRGRSWSSYWATLLTTIGYSHPMLPGLTIDKVGGLWTITSHTIDDFRKTLPSPTVKYVNATSGLDTNDGNTAGTAYKTINKLNSVSYDRAYLTGGCYAGTASPFIYGSRELIASEEAFICRGYLGSELSWTDAGGGVFTCSATANQVVVDTNLTDANGDPTALVKVADAAAVAATAGTYFRNTGTNTLYVRMFDDLTPNRANVLVAIATMGNVAAVYSHMEKLTLIGGFTNNGNNVTTGYITAKNCKFIHRVDSNAFNITRNVYIWLEDCVAARARDDGYNYHAGGGLTPYVVEVNCVGRNCGGSDNYGLSNSINNGSSAHEGVVLLRLYGDYNNTEGACVHDVNQAISLNIACNAHDSISIDEGNKSGFATGVSVGDTSKVYLFECTTSGATTVGVENRIPATAHIYGRFTDGIHSIEAGTTLEAF